MEGTTRSEKIFPVESEYARCINGLTKTGIIAFLPGPGSQSVTGIDGQEYPVPTAEQVAALIELNGEMVKRKVLQGFDRLELTPMALPLHYYIVLLQAAVIRHASQGKIFQTRYNPVDPLVPVRVNSKKQVSVWDTLLKLSDTDDLGYFPQDYSGNHRLMTKTDAIHNSRICAVPGWSVGLVERRPLLPRPGQGKTLAGRRQPETGLSPHEYLHMLQSEPYLGETGKTLEDFITGFLCRLEEANEVSHDRYNDNALWCLGQYAKISYAELVPTGWWHREYGKVRLDMHRTGNKRCTKSWGASTMVRLKGL